MGAATGFCAGVCAGASIGDGADAAPGGTSSRSGSTAAEAAPSAARLANSRRDSGLSVGGIVVTGQREVLGHTEATESSARGQPRRGIGDRLERNCPLVEIILSQPRFRPFQR